MKFPGIFFGRIKNIGLAFAPAVLLSGEKPFLAGGMSLLLNILINRDSRYLVPSLDQKTFDRVAFQQLIRRILAKVEHIHKVLDADHIIFVLRHIISLLFLPQRYFLF